MEAKDVIDRMSDIRNPSEKEFSDKRLIAALYKFKGKTNLYFLYFSLKNYQFVVTVLTVKNLQQPGRPKLMSVEIWRFHELYNQNIQKIEM